MGIFDYLGYVLSGSDNIKVKSGKCKSVAQIRREAVEFSIPFTCSKRKSASRFGRRIFCAFLNRLALKMFKSSKMLVAFSLMFSLTGSKPAGYTAPYAWRWPASSGQ